MRRRWRARARWVGVVALVGMSVASQAGAQTADGSAPPAPAPSLLQRWIDPQTALFVARYREVTTSAGVESTNQMQDSITLRARITFDPQRRFALGTLVGTGSGFTSSWNNTGIGTGDALKTLYLKQLFVSAAPIKGLEAFYGGFGVVRGESTEITSYDNDGYLLGSRVSVKRPANVYLDEVTFTNGYLGDTAQSSFLSRTQHLSDVNYRQALVVKKLRPWISASTDYTWLTGAHDTIGTWRAAVTVKTKAVAHVVDLVRWEQYRRGGSDSAFGFAGYGEKAISKRITAGGGYADIDPNYGGLNADRFNRGRRLYQTGSVKLTRELTASVFVTEAVHNDVPIANHRRFDLLIAYDALASLQRAGLFR